MIPDALLSSPVVWYGQAALAFVALFLLTVAIAVEWPAIATAWRRVLIIGVVEHAVIAYGSWEARRSDVAVELRVFLLMLTLIGLVIALLILLVDHRRGALYTSERARVVHPQRHRPRVP
jgi:hypothetical protein